MIIIIIISGVFFVYAYLLARCHPRPSSYRRAISARRTTVMYWTTGYHLAAQQDHKTIEISSRRSRVTAVTDQAFNSLLNSASEHYHPARIPAAAADNSGISGDLLHALPISACGLRLSNGAVRITVGLRLGTELCQPNSCLCGAIVDTRGSHILTRSKVSGRPQRHHYLNDLIWRAM